MATSSDMPNPGEREEFIPTRRSLLGRLKHWDEEWERHLVEVAIRRVKARVQSKHFQIFDLAVINAWPVKDIMQTLNVNRAQIYLVKHRVSNRVKKETQRLDAATKETGPIGQA